MSLQHKGFNKWYYGEWYHMMKMNINVFIIRPFLIYKNSRKRMGINSAL